MIVTPVEDATFTMAEVAYLGKPANGDFAIIRIPERLAWRERLRLHEWWEETFPGSRAFIVALGVEIGIARDMGMMVREDLYTFGDGLHVDWLVR
jgi:hypothetical protein